jgi:ABC-type phosphate/phosphonate transport system substrate-binding protein
MAWKIALPMYNVSQTMQDGYEAFLEALIDSLRVKGWRDAIELVRDPTLPEFWNRPDMLLSQSCGYPYMTQLQGHARLLATPCYRVAGCSGTDYSSVIVVREGSGINRLTDARDGIAAVNDAHSNSGMNMLRHTVAPESRNGHFFGEIKFSGGHAASLAMVRHGDADIAAIDCVTFSYIRQENPAWIKGLSILQYSAASPCLPLITSNRLPEIWLTQLRSALLEPTARISALLEPLHIQKFKYCGDENYIRIMHLEQEAQALGYAILA